jgi:CRISPR/Cas system CSM-associated protein Csm3 (group 7 of RAMP superfamily)
MRLEAQLEIKTRSALSIGGLAPSGMGIDKGMVRDNEGQMIIPASTIKGKLRSECERILRSINPDIVCRPPRAEDMCPHYELPLQKNKPIYERELCPVCKLFGTNGSKARLYFSDAKLNRTEPEKEQLKGLDSQPRPGVTISRRRKTAEDERLYFIETSASNAGFIFTGKVNGDIDSNKEAALLLAGIYSIVAIGGGKSRGIGWVGIEIERMTLDGAERDPKQLLGHIEEWRP